jgi:hypothetical protein
MDFQYSSDSLNSVITEMFHLIYEAAQGQLSVNIAKKAITKGNS